jgi:hypothetical protein
LVARFEWLRLLPIAGAFPQLTQILDMGVPWLDC